MNSNLPDLTSIQHELAMIDPQNVQIPQFLQLVDILDGKLN